jgi:hypothetical protein
MCLGGCDPDILEGEMDHGNVVDENENENDTLHITLLSLRVDVLARAIRVHVSIIIMVI